MQNAHLFNLPEFRSFGQTVLVLVMASSAGAVAAMPCTSMSLVLAIDGSGSISEAEFTLQLAATAFAISEPEVVNAMAGLGGVAVSAVIWGDTGFGAHTLDWVRIADRTSAEQFAVQLASQDRRVSGNTDLGNGISVALDLIDNPANCASYNVIDVSGDGRETLFSNRRSTSLAVARELAKKAGVVINGLAISSADEGLADYYEDHVITGPGAFVIEATSLDAFADAMKRKLLREIEGYPYALTALVTGNPETSVLTQPAPFDVQ